MELTVLNGANGDLNQIRLELKATNTSTNPIILDKELVAGFGLRFRTDISEGPIYSEEKDVSSKTVNKLKRPPASAAKHRFITLEPGKSLVRKYDLSKAVRIVREGHMSDLNMAHYGFYGEEMVRYHVPKQTKQLLIDAWYERGVWMMALPQFEAWHGRSAKEIGLWGGRAHSNTVVVERK